MTSAASAPSLTFAAGLPGFPDCRRFALVEIEGGGPFSLMRSLDVADLDFVVVPAAAVFPDYAPIVDDDTAERLGVSSADDALVLLIVTVDADAGRVTANLAGPVIVHAASGEAAQVVLSSDVHELRAPVGAL